MAGVRWDRGIELHADLLDLPSAQLRRAFEESSIAVSAIQGVPTLLSADPTERSHAVWAIRQRLRAAGELGAVGVLLVPQFGRSASLPDLSPWKTGAEMERELLHQLRDLAPFALEAGVTLFLEPLNRYEAYIVNRIEQGATLAQEVGPGIAVMADFFHMNIEESDLADSIRNAADHIVYVHVADSNRLQPGMGHLDFGSGFAALKEAGYDGFLGLECRIHGDYDAAVRAAVHYLRERWDAAS